MALAESLAIVFTAMGRKELRQSRHPVMSAFPPATQRTSLWPTAFPVKRMDVASVTMPIGFHTRVTRIQVASPSMQCDISSDSQGYGSADAA
ncbi:uncharacterized protein CCOS01_11961 [Colletotrichum costaricense]|uniref:Uncharacterized protein n=1 Tax=Colletotrichum costaricense TaxID=1209916 RepID=A0AAJ0DW49_9PEZI|nr:uncharacterized protein CCOS01_11961 [Colletotrichum costaricense]KAK1517704.1 hypothetical protein CCOS01_11961 [Colletotrichum costaricense]